MDYAGPETCAAGEELIVKTLDEKIKPKMKKSVTDKLRQIQDGKRDVYI
jgi:hypothetical protein